MQTTRVRGWLEKNPLVFGTGSLFERLRRNPAVVYDEHLANAALIYQPDAAALVEETLREYVAVAADAQLPVLLSTATWKASAPRLQRSVYAERDVNGDQYRFLRRFVDEYAPALDALIAGAMGPLGDAYKPQDGLDVDAAEQVHAPQARQLAEAGVDLIVAWTMPSLDEARGLARALAATDRPYILSFVVREAGSLLDGTTLADAIGRIDDQRGAAPLGYFLNCVHPSIARAALDRCPRRERVIGLKANASSLSPEALAQSSELRGDGPDAFARAFSELLEDHALKYVAGCCGTSTEHMRALANHLRH